MQKGDKSKCANKYETQRSTAENIFTRRRVGVAHPSAQHPGLTVTPAPVSLPAAFRTRMAGVLQPLTWTLSVTFLYYFSCSHCGFTRIAVYPSTALRPVTVRAFIYFLNVFTNDQVGKHYRSWEVILDVYRATRLDEMQSLLRSQPSQIVQNSAQKRASGL